MSEDNSLCPIGLMVDVSAKPSSIPKESVLPMRPVFETKGSRKTLKLFLVNLDLIKQLVESLDLS